MTNTANQLLSLARKQLQNATPGWDAEKAALRILEHGIQDQHDDDDDCIRDPRIWACIGYLRRRQGDLVGEKHAKLLACEYRNILPSRFNFKGELDKAESGLRKFNVEDDMNIIKKKQIMSSRQNLQQSYGNNIQVEQVIKKNRLLKQHTEELLKQAGVDCTQQLMELEKGENFRTKRLLKRSKELRQITKNLLTAAMQS